MKGTDIFCTSHASTSICLSMEELVSSSSSSSSVIQLGGRSISCSHAVDPYNPIIKERIGGTGRSRPVPPCSSNSRRIGGSDRNEPLPPSSSQPSISPKQKNHNKKSTSSKPSKETKKKSSSSSSWSCTKPGDFITPTGFTRYYLNEKDIKDVLAGDYDPVLKLIPSSSSLVNPKSCKDVKVAADHESCNPSKPPSSCSGDQQVVVLRVSLHCRGCEKKMRKHISRMEGVTSFNIDFAAKRVTVIGDVTPLGVLASISKVKNAQLWSPTEASSVPPAKANHDLINSELKNTKQAVVSDYKLENLSRNQLSIQL